jgi:hypothetical protein
LLRGEKSARHEIFFIIFVDVLFTTLFERPFTKVFDVIAQTTAGSCLYLARNAD